MKRNRFFRFTGLGVITAVFLFSRVVSAQMPGGVDTTLMKLFGKAPSFTAKCEAKVVDTNDAALLTTPMTFTKLDDKIRVDVDLSQIKGASIAAADLARMKQMGMDRIASVTRLDKKQMYLIYPGLKSYIALPLDKEEAEAAAKPQLDAKPVGKETIDGHPCVKNLITVTNSVGQSRETITWNATDLKDFPLQIRSTENNVTMVMRSSQVQFTKPDAKQFDPPAGYTKYDSMQSLMIAIATSKAGTK